MATRNYAKEYANYGGREDQKKNRAARNQARAELMREGVVHKGDGQDVDHRTPIAKGGGNSRSNLRAVPASQNRSFSRTRSARMR